MEEHKKSSSLEKLATVLLNSLPNDNNKTLAKMTISNLMKMLESTQIIWAYHQILGRKTDKPRINFSDSNSFPHNSNF